MVTSCCIHGALFFFCSQMNPGLELNAVHFADVKLKWGNRSLMQRSVLMHYCVTVCESVWVNGGWKRREKKKLWLVFFFLSQRLAHCFQQTEQKNWSLLFLCTAFIFLKCVNTGTQQAIFQHNIRVMLLTSSFPYNVLGRAESEWGVTLHGLKS